MQNLSLNLLSMLLIIQTPILLAALASHIASRSGYFNVAIEGIMTLGAFFGVLLSHYLQNAYLAIVLCILLGIVQGILLYYLDRVLNINSILVGIAYNLFAIGLSSTLLGLVGDRGISTSLVPVSFSKHTLYIFGTEIYYNFPVILSLVVILIIYLLNNKTVIGIRMLAVGKNTEFSEISGLNINKYKAISILISAGLASLAGASLTLGYLPWFSRGMVAGRGFVGLAIDAMGSGSVVLTSIMAFIISNVFTITTHQSLFNVKAELLEMIPYIVVFVIIIIINQFNRIKRN